MRRDLILNNCEKNDTKCCKELLKCFIKCDENVDEIEMKMKMKYIRIFVQLILKLTLYLNNLNDIVIMRKLKVLLDKHSTNILD